MRPLTDATPKPLLEAGGKALIAWQLERLGKAGVREVVVNVSHLGDRLEAALGDGSRFGVRIAWSREASPLETAGGVARALPLLGAGPFAVVSADLYTEFDYASLAPVARRIAADPARCIAHFVLVENPPWHARGDMSLSGGLVRREGDPRFTYANISVFHPSFFGAIAPGARLRMFPYGYRYVDEGRVTGELFRGAWDNVGTPGQLAALDRRLTA
jgi:MurNAc alpha-1-phosphate uridylyltransferase